MGHPFLVLILFRWRLLSAPFYKNFNLKAAVLRFVIFLGSSAVALTFNWTALTLSRFQSFRPNLGRDIIHSVASLVTAPHFEQVPPPSDAFGFRSFEILA